MGLDIGLRPTDNKVIEKLLGANMIIFVFVLAIFSLSVYGFAVNISYAHLKGKLSALSSSIIASIDSGETMPDLVRYPTPDVPRISLTKTNVLWFSSTGKLITERGDAEISSPFDKNASFQTQNNPHILLLTRPAFIDGKLLGYVRIGESLSDLDQETENLRWGLVLGIVVALTASAAGILWLTKQLLSPIEEAFLRLKQFTDDASHELRGPIMAIKSNCSIVLKHTKNFEMIERECVVRSLNAANQMEKLTDDLLLLAKADQNQNLLSASDTQSEASELVRDIVAVLKPVADAKSIEIVTSMLKPMNIRGTSDELKRLLSNIVENAIAYTPEHGKVTINCFQRDGDCIARVADTGIGIAEADLPKIFNRFWRADRARSYRSGGTGLGLAIAQSLARRHGGTISATSKVGAGSCFTIKLPSATNTEYAIKGKTN